MSPETGLYKSRYQLLQPYGSFADFHGTPVAAERMIFRQLKSEMGKSFELFSSRAFK